MIYVILSYCYNFLYSCLSNQLSGERYANRVQFVFYTNQLSVINKYKFQIMNPD